MLCPPTWSRRNGESSLPWFLALTDFNTYKSVSFGSLYGVPTIDIYIYIHESIKKRVFLLFVIIVLRVKLKIGCTETFGLSDFFRHVIFLDLFI